MTLRRVAIAVVLMACLPAGQCVVPIATIGGDILIRAVGLDTAAIENIRAATGTCVDRLLRPKPCPTPTDTHPEPAP